MGSCSKGGKATVKKKQESFNRTVKEYHGKLPGLGEGNGKRPELVNLKKWLLSIDLENRWGEKVYALCAKVWVPWGSHPKAVSGRRVSTRVLKRRKS